MKETICAICRTHNQAYQLYPARLEVEKFNASTFSARRIPKKKKSHYRLVVCRKCGLVRSDPVYEDKAIEQLYQLSNFTYLEEVTNLKKTYGHYLAEIIKNYIPSLDKYLDVGCGNGFILEEAQKLGFRNVFGVEPSYEAYKQAAEVIRPKIKNCFFKPGLYEANSFDLISIFQTLDHLNDPFRVLKEAYRILKPNGVILILNHDLGALTNRILGETSPVIDIQHTYLFNRQNIKKILENTDFKLIKIIKARNFISAKYLIQLLPINYQLKEFMSQLITKSGLGKKSLWLRLGNLAAVAQKSKGNNLQAIATDVRKKVVRMIGEAKGCHVGTCLSVVDILTVLYFRIMSYCPQQPKEPRRDRFILSKGHGAAALYVTLAKAGFFSEDKLKDYLKNGTRFTAHINHHGIPGIELSTGSLGHGLSVSLGLALAAKKANSSYRVFVVLSDGELDEGSNWEAFLMAGNYHLDNLTVIIDCNKIQSFGWVEEIMPLEPLRKKLESFHWAVKEVDGHSIRELVAALSNIPFQKNKPSVIVAHTIKGKGVSFMENKVEWHYLTPTMEQVTEAEQELSQYED